jgi:hypothetical protein
MACALTWWNQYRCSPSSVRNFSDRRDSQADAIRRAIGTGMLSLIPNRPSTGCAMHRALALVIAVVLLLLTPLTYLEQSDPLWIGGIWDDDDFDAVVVLVKSTEVPRDSDQSAFVPLEPCLYAPPPTPVWRPIVPPLRWPENRAPPDA